MFPTITDAVHFAQDNIPQLKVQQLCTFYLFLDQFIDLGTLLQPARQGEPTQFGAAAG
jgi:hypothetical protein